MKVYKLTWKERRRETCTRCLERGDVAPWSDRELISFDPQEVYDKEVELNEMLLGRNSKSYWETSNIDIFEAEIHSWKEIEVYELPC